eukprot:7036299-Pyramimonas_sp.AAC.1
MPVYHVWARSWFVVVSLRHFSDVKLPACKGQVGGRNGARLPVAGGYCAAYAITVTSMFLVAT